MIVLTYKCKGCKYESQLLDGAQEHSNETRHHVDVSGFMTPNKEAKNNKMAIDARAAQSAREAIIMRLAKHKGLV